MPNPELCTEDEVIELVHTFYGTIRRDEVLGPIFNRHVADWDEHLAKLVDFWSAILRGTRRFSGTPMPKHVVLPELSAELFQRWLMLFRQTTAALPNHDMAQHANAAAERIAQSLWFGYQMSRSPDTLPDKL